MDRNEVIGAVGRRGLLGRGAGLGRCAGLGCARLTGACCGVQE